MQKFTITLVLFLSVIVLTFSNCRKEAETIATVIVLDAGSDAVAGKYVRIYCPTTTCGDTELDEDISRTSITGSNGKVSFNYTESFQLGQAGFAVLDVAVYDNQADMDLYVNALTTGVIKIEEEKENEQTIICQSCI